MAVQVALLFLVQDRIPTEPIWAAFIASAAELQLKTRVPPTRPKQPDYFAEVEVPPEERELKCWRHGGKVTGRAGLMGPKEPYQGAAPVPASKRVPDHHACAWWFHADVTLAL